jgi:hypothetical protein
MSENTGGGRRRRVRLAPPVIACGVAVAVAACGAGPPAGGASGGSPYQQALAYARCMRGHGDPGFPDPNSRGLFPHPAGPQYGSATRTCGHLLRSQPLTAAQKQQHVTQALRFARCVRSHGVPDFPDPIIVGGGTAIGFRPARADRNSPQLLAAVQACRRFEPGMARALAGGGAA